jgi:hypothetical protein
MTALNRLITGMGIGLALTAALGQPALADKISASGKNPPINTTTPADIEIASPVDAIDWGDDSSEYAKDNECDDPRFTGSAMGAEPLESNIRKDATDCKAAYVAGTVTLKPATPPPAEPPATEPPAPPEPPVAPPADIPAADAIDFGDDSSEWAKDGECDDPRFAGNGSADELVDADVLKDATDCRTAYEAGTIALNPDYRGGPSTTEPVIDYGDDTSKWAKDGECDDPRFSGTGVAGELVEEDRGHDATDCKAAVEAGKASYNGETPDIAVTPPTAPAEFDYGSDFSKWAKDGECDDLRFEGAGVDKKLLTDDLNGDATDCKAAVDAGTATIRPVYSPEYAAGAPYDSSAIDFGDNTSDYADDQSCDDPRFEGPGAASIVLEDDLKHDSNDCKAGFEAGKIVLKAGAEG